MYRQQRLRITRRTVLSAVVGTACLAALGCQATVRAGRLRIGTGGLGGVYHTYGTAVAAAVRARLPRLEPTVLVTAASIENIRLVAAGQAELGFSLADSAGSAHFGEAPFAAPTALAALAKLYDNYLHLVVGPDSPIRTVEQVAGRRVSLGASGSGTELTSTRLLAAVGLDADADLRSQRLGVDDSAAALVAGELDGFFFSGGIPTAAIDALARVLPVRLVNLAGLVSRLRKRYGEVYAERTIPASTYRLPDPVTTIGVPNYLVVSPSMDAQLAYALIQTLFAERDRLAAAHPEGRRLDRGAAINTFPLPLHPGAQRYYRDVKP